MCFWVTEFRQLYYPTNALIAVDTYQKVWHETHDESVWVQYHVGAGFFEVRAESYTLCLQARDVITEASKQVFKMQTDKGMYSD